MPSLNQHKLYFVILEGDAVEVINQGADVPWSIENVYSLWSFLKSISMFIAHDIAKWAIFLSSFGTAQVNYIPLDVLQDPA